MSGSIFVKCTYGVCVCSGRVINRIRIDVYPCYVLLPLCRVKMSVFCTVIIYVFRHIEMSLAADGVLTVYAVCRNSWLTVTLFLYACPAESCTIVVDCMSAFIYRRTIVLLSDFDVNSYSDESIFCRMYRQ
jgi:hypothetical protein